MVSVERRERWRAYVCHIPRLGARLDPIRNVLDHGGSPWLYRSRETYKVYSVLFPAMLAYVMYSRALCRDAHGISIGHIVRTYTFFHNYRHRSTIVVFFLFSSLFVVLACSVTAAAAWTIRSS